jgi:hypothetical protein
MAIRNIPEIPGYSAPTLGSTSIGSGATVTEVTGLSLASPTIKYPVTSSSVTDEIYYASTMYLVDFPETGNEEGIRYMTAAGDDRFAVGDVVSVTGMNIAAANVTNKTIVSVSGQEITVFVGAGNVLARNVSAYNAAGQTPTMTKAGVTTQSPGTAGQVLKSNGTGVEWGTVSSLPSQTDNAGKFLGTDGTNAAWLPVSTTTSYITKTNTYQFAAGDENNIFSMNNTTPNPEFRIPTDDTYNFSIGTQINVLWIGASSFQPKIVASTPGTTTIISTAITSASPLLRTVNSMATCVKLSSNLWTVVGDIY